MRFCCHCGAALEKRVPPDDDRQRDICPSCGTIHYVNPKAVVGCLVEHDGGLLLCRRAIEPARGLWTPPAGYLEIDESAVEGALRETHEEARARVDILGPHSHLDLPHIGQHYLLFRARLVGDAYEPGPESEEVELFPLERLPWDELAFPVMHFALELYVADRRAGRHRVHVGVVRWSGEGSRYDPDNYRLEAHMGLPLARE